MRDNDIITGYGSSQHQNKTYLIQRNKTNGCFFVQCTMGSGASFIEQSTSSISPRSMVAGRGRKLSSLGRKKMIEYISCWPGTILEWSDTDLNDFASCFTGYSIAADKEVSGSFLVVLCFLLRFNFHLRYTKRVPPNFPPFPPPHSADILKQSKVILHNC